MTFLKWLAKATLQTTAGNIVLSALILVGIGSAGAATLTSYDVTNEPQMNLDVSINSTQTTGIVLAAPQLNADDHTFASTTGSVLRIRWGAYREDIYATGATINVTTKKVTLVGVTRNLCPQVTRSYTSCGDGRAWGKGAIVELIQDARLFNLKANIDRKNTFTASGGLAFSGSGSLTIPTFSTTAERDRQMGASGGDFRAACVTATGLCYLRLGGTWTEIGDTGTSNATTTTSGKVEITTVTDISNGSLTGDSGAPLAISTSLVTQTSTGSTQANKIPALSSDGKLDDSLFSVAGDAFGNGSDGSVTISATGSLASDKHYTTLQVNTGVTLNTAGYRIYASTKIILYGKIASNGGAGGNGAAGENGSAGGAAAAGAGGFGGSKANTGGTIPGSLAGVAGGAGGAGRATDGVGNAGTAGTAGLTSTGSIADINGVVGAAAGAGGTETSAGGAAGAGGAIGASRSASGASLFEALRQTIQSVSSSRLHGRGTAGSGAGGGGGGGARAGGGAEVSGAGGGGGGSGAPGGNIEIYARVIQGAGSITANGGAGGNGGNGGCTGGANKGGGGGGGAGSGGGGGWIMLVYQTITNWTGSATVTGGAAGTRGTGGPICSGGGTAGADGNNGTAGPTGKVIRVQLQ